jgi:hypothetical protein
MLTEESPALFKEEQAVHGAARRWTLWIYSAFWLAVGAIDLAGDNPFDARQEGGLFIFTQWPMALALATLGHWFIASQWGPHRLHITVLPTDVFVSIAAHAGKAENIRFQTDLIEGIVLLAPGDWRARIADPGEARVFTLEATQGVEVSLRGGERILLGTERADALAETLRIGTGEDRHFVHVDAEDLASDEAWEHLLATLLERLETLPRDGFTLRLRTGMVPHTLRIARLGDEVFSVGDSDAPEESTQVQGIDSALVHAAQFAQAGFFVEREWTEAQMRCPTSLRESLETLREDGRTWRLRPRVDEESLHLSTPLWTAEDPPLSLEIDDDGDLVIHFLEVDSHSHAILRRHTVAADEENLPQQLTDLMAGIPDEAVHFRPLQRIGLRLPL